MKILMPTNRKILLAVTVLYTGMCSYGQTVNYTIVDNAPKTHFLTVDISPLDFRLMEGNPLAGPALMAEVRPLNRLSAQTQLASFLYTPSEGIINTGFKKAGGISADFGAAFAYVHRGINLVHTKGDTIPINGHFRIKTSGNVESYINYPFNRLVERQIRGGGFYYNFPTEEGTTLTLGGYAGIGKTTYKSATLNVDGVGELTRWTQSGYYIDVLFGSSEYAIPDNGETNTAGLGVRLGYKMIYAGGLFPLSVTFEFGSLPGDSGGMMRLKLAGNILSGKQSYKGGYVYRKKAKKTIPALIQAL